ncbi:MAG: PilZ domain-containing protein [Desulfobulbaceae bacterium]|nr:PilZ domain-containing protein [Desulfobulbaceae bacterium]
MTLPNAERRKYPRFRVREGTYAFIDNIPFMIQDISEGGMKIQSVVFDEAPLENLKVEIFVNNGKFYLRDVPVRLVSLLQDNSMTPFSTVHVRRFGFEFKNLDEQQKILLDNLITYNTVGDS